MAFLEFVQVVLCILLLAFFITQILIPMWKGTPWFPLFKRRRKNLEEELGKVKEEVDNVMVEREIEKEKEKIIKIKPKTKEDK